MTHRDKQGRPVVALTGMGMVAPLGQGKADNWAALTAGKSGTSTLQSFPLGHLKTPIPGGTHFAPVAPACAATLALELAMRSCEEAVGQSRLGHKGDFPGELYVAVAPMEVEWWQRQALADASGKNEGITYADLIKSTESGRFKGWHDLALFGTVADRIAERFGTRGSPVTLSTACSSGATAIQLGVEAIRRGDTQAALVLGTDGSVAPEPLIRFSLLSALSTQNDPPGDASKPFSKNRDGFVMGEGAGALVLED